MPGSLLWRYSPVPGRSVPLSCVTRYCSGVSFAMACVDLVYSPMGVSCVTRVRLCPCEVVIAQRQVPIALSRDLEHRVANGRLHRSGAVVPHAVQPMPRLEEPDIDLGRVFVDARKQ